MDIEILLALQSVRTAWLDAFFLGVTELGNQLVSVLVVCLLYWCVNKRSAIYIGMNLFFGLLVNQTMKLTCCIARPWVRDARVVPVAGAMDAATGFSFPSGHTANATALFGAVAALYPKKRGLHLAMFACILLVGFSRLYLGVHTIWDVLFSLAVGVVILRVGARVFAALDRKPELDIRLAGVLIALAGILMVYAAVKPYPAGIDPELVLDAYKAGGAVIGLCVGWCVERRTLRFSVQAPPIIQALKFLLGMGVNIVILSYLKAPFNALLGDVAGNMLRYALLAFFMIYLWPLMFTKIIGRYT